MKIAAGTASENISKKLSEITGIPLLKMEIKRFPDKECYVKVKDEICSDDILVINTAFPDENIVETLLIQDAVCPKADKVITVIPYLGYSRQDKIFKSGESLSARAVVKALSANTDYFAALNLHKGAVMDYSLVPGTDISTYGVTADYLSKLTNPPDMIMAPDRGARHIASGVAALMDIEWDYLEKTRLNGEHVEIKPASSSVKGKIVAIADDIISTGGTIATATSRLKEKGAKKVYALCTHGLFIGQAKKKMNVCDIVASSDTIETEFSEFSAAGAIADFIKKNLF